MRSIGPSSCRPAGDGAERTVGDGHAGQLEERLLRVGESFEHQAEAEPCATPLRRPTLSAICGFQGAQASGRRSRGPAPSGVDGGSQRTRQGPAQRRFSHRRTWRRGEANPVRRAPPLRRSLSAICGFQSPQPAGPQKPWSSAAITGLRGPTGPRRPRVVPGRGARAPWRRGEAEPGRRSRVVEAKPQREFWLPGRCLRGATEKA